MPMYICKEDNSNKFWSYSEDGNEVTIEWGRIGLSGQSQVKNFSSDGEKRRFITKKVQEKIDKGYKESDDKELQKEKQTADLIGHQNKIHRMEFVRRVDDDLHVLPSYDPSQGVYVEIMNSWKREIVRFFITKKESFEVEGITEERDKYDNQIISCSEMRTSYSQFVNAIRTHLRTLSQTIVQTIGMLGRRLEGGSDEDGVGVSPAVNLADMIMSKASMDGQVARKFASLGRILEI